MATSETTMRRAAYLATLTGAQLRPSAEAALMNAKLAPTVENANQIIDDHRSCYPPTTATTVFEPLHPDRLGEDFVALTDPRNPHRDNLAWLCDDWTLTALPNLLANPTSDTSHEWAPAAVATLVETARRWPHIATEVLYPLVRERPDLAIAAGGVTLARLATLDGVDIPTLVAIDALLPANRHVDLDVAGAAVSAALTPLRLADISDPNERAHLLATHSLRVSNAGRSDEALTIAQEAVTIRRQLAKANPAAYLPDLAMSLNNLSNVLSELGRRDEALATAQEAVTIRRQLAKANPAAYLPNLATSLWALAHVSVKAKCGLAEALVAAEEAITIFGSLTQQFPQRFAGYLASAIATWADVLEGLGRVEEASEVRRQLSELGS